MFWQKRRQRDFNAEVEAHLRLETDRLIEQGRSPEAARQEARRGFGNILQAEERFYERAHWRWWDDARQDVIYGSRMLRKNPAFSAIAILTLALGIGVNTTIFSFMGSMLLRQPPVHDPDRVVALTSWNPAPTWQPDLSPVSAPDFEDWRSQATSYSMLAAGSFDEFTFSDGVQPERVEGGQVSADYFQLLGVQPTLGRTFAADEDKLGKSHVVMIGEELWKRRFGGDPRVIGRSVKVNGEPYSVIGVVPGRFELMTFPADIWMPLVFTPDQLAPAARTSRFLNVVGRLKPGASTAQAHAELDAIARRLAANHPESDKGWRANVMTLRDFIVKNSNVTAAMALLMGAVGFVLLIACVNLANLLLARNAARQREFAIRSSLGAARFRLVRQLLIECVLLSLGGGALGLLFAFWGLRLILTQLNWNTYAVRMASQISIDGRALLFTLAISVAAALVFGLAPSLELSRPDLNSTLKEGGRSGAGGRKRRRFERILVPAELALSVILVVGAGLFVKSLIDELHSQLGFDRQNLLTATISLDGREYQEPARRTNFFQSVLDQLANMPPVQSAAIASDLPLTFPATTSFTFEGRPAPARADEPTAGYFAISPGYFATLRLPLLQGREFTLADRAGSAPVVVVDRAFAKKYFPGENPIGRRIAIHREGATGAGWSEIVGLVPDVNEFLSQADPRPHLYEPFLARPAATMRVVVRTRNEPTSFAPFLRRAVWNVDKDQPVTDLWTMDRVIQNSEQGDGLMTGLMSTFAGIALVLAAIGIYGVLANMVGRRTQEIGIRMALGARRGEVVGLMIRNAAVPVFAGVGIGFLVSLVLPRLLGAMFNGYHVQAGVVLTVTPLLVIAVSFAACYLPARRASRVDPVTALRWE